MENTKLHLYVEMKDNESSESAINRTHEIIEILFSNYGYGVLEIEENEDIENEIKAFISVDTNSDNIYKITSDLSVQVY